MRTITRSTLKALLTALITAAVLIFILAFIAYRTSDPDRLLAIFGMAVFFVSSFMGSAVAKRELNSVMGSIIFCAVYILVCLAVSLVLGNKPGIVKLLLTYGAGMAASVLAAFIFSGGKGKKPKSLKRYKAHRNRVKK